MSRLLIGLVLLCGGLCLAAAPGLHPDSLSSTAITVAGAQAHLVMRCQMLSLLEVIPDLDADGDGQVDGAEVQRSRVPIVDYIDTHYGLVVGSDRQFEGGTRLSPQFLRLEHFAPGTEGGKGYRMGAVEIELLYAAPEPIVDLHLHSTLFADTSPGHIDMVELRRENGTPEHFALMLDTPRHRSDPEGRGAFAAYVPLGWHHILGGWDHLAFVFVLVLGSRRLRSVLGVITAFTVAHSVTLALATLDVVDLSAWTHLMEGLIALSIGYVAADIALFPTRLRNRWGEAFVFGLVHGFGFAAFLRASLVNEAAKPLALLGFNVGVELGQIPVALVAGLVLARLPRGSGAPAAANPAAVASEQALAPLGVRRVAGAVLAVVGLWVFVDRVWGG